MHTFFSRNFIATTVKKYWRSRRSSCAQNGIKLIVKWCRFPTPATNVVIVLYLSKIMYYNEAIHFLAIDLTFLYASTRFLNLGTTLLPSVIEPHVLELFSHLEIDSFIPHYSVKLTLNSRVSPNLKQRLRFFCCPAASHLEVHYLYRNVLTSHVKS